MSNSMEIKKSGIKKSCVKPNEYWLDKFRIKQCFVNLSRVLFTKVEIKCTQKVDESSWRITQDGVNCFTLSIKRKEKDDLTLKNPSKKLKPNVEVQREGNYFILL